jgi:hypothetical protein
MGFVRSPGFIPGVIVGVLGSWAFHKYVKNVPGKGA